MRECVSERLSEPVRERVGFTLYDFLRFTIFYASYEQSAAKYERSA